MDSTCFEFSSAASAGPDTTFEGPRRCSLAHIPDQSKPPRFALLNRNARRRSLLELVPATLDLGFSFWMLSLLLDGPWPAGGDDSISPHSGCNFTPSQTELKVAHDTLQKYTISLGLVPNLTEARAGFLYFPQF